jgi:hypothetical protein
MAYTFPNIFMTPELGGNVGLLDDEIQKALQQQATKAGLLTTAVDFLTAPRTRQVGSFLPYAGTSFTRGMQTASNVYGTGLQQAIAKQLKEPKMYTVDGALVDAQGNVVYQSPLPEKKEESLFAKIDTSKFTPQSLSEVQKTQDLSKLVLMKQGDKDYKNRYIELLTIQNDPNRELTVSENAELNALARVVKEVSPKGTDGTTMQPPSGYLWRLNPDGTRFIDPNTQMPVAVPIPGTKESVAREEAKQKKEVGESGKATIASTVLVDAQRALDTIESNPDWTTGATGFVLQAVPGTDAFALGKMVDSVKANIGIDKLLDIKASGAGLGQVPQSQLDMLASVLGGLDIGQPIAVLEYNLKRVKTIYGDIVKAAGGQEALDQALSASVETPEAQKLREQTPKLPEGVKVRKKNG